MKKKLLLFIQISFLTVRIKSLIIFIVIFCSNTSNVQSQNVVNNGSNIVINSGAYLVVSGNYINNFNVDDGVIDIDGTILIDGNWVNNANNAVFENIELIPDGNVIMRGINPQFIGGSNFTDFENLTIIRSPKTLQVSQCKVKGHLTVDAVLKLNSKRFIIDNKNQDGIIYKSKYILSETSSVIGYGEVQWNIGSEINTYAVPFGSGLSNNNDLNLILSTKTQGLPAEGNIVFATYPTDCSNEYLPLGVGLQAGESENVADRYWIINADYSMSKPISDIVFKYTFDDVDPCNDGIIQENLKARRFNNVLNQWDDIPSMGIANKNDRTVKVTSLASDDFFVPWCLLVEPKPPLNIFFPNAFSPDGDGINDFFGPVGLDLDKYTFTMYIFDRWGEMIYETDSALKLWNGKPTGSSTIAPIGVYTWLVILFDDTFQEYKWTGRVTLVR